MTRNDIAKSLKPIEWVYNHRDNTYMASCGIGANRIGVYIRKSLHHTSLLLLRILRNGSFVEEEEYEICHKTLDSAMQEAREFLITEVCSLFELDEQ